VNNGVGGGGGGGCGGDEIRGIIYLTVNQIL